MDNERIEALAKELGDAAARAVDVDRMADRVVRRLRSTPRRPKPGILSLKAAAVVAVLVVGGVVAVRLSGPGTSDPVALAGPPGLEQFSMGELHEVLDSLDLATPVSELGPASLDDLDEGELRELLEAMTG